MHCLPYTDVYPSSLCEWQPVESFTGTFQALHGDFGRLLYQNKNPSFFLAEGIYLYEHKYIVPTNETDYGTLERIPSPTLSSLSEWELLDLQTIQSFKHKVIQDIHKAMMFGRISKRLKLSWFIPLHIFTACFNKIHMQRTKTMWLCRRIQSQDLDAILGDEWKVKEGVHKGDSIRCCACCDSVVMSYHIHRQTLYMGLEYRRWKKTQGCWKPLDSESIQQFEVQVHLGNDNMKTLKCNNKWSLKDMRTTLLLLGDGQANCRFKIDGRRINRRLEASMSSETCLPPSILSFEM